MTPNRVKIISDGHFFNSRVEVDGKPLNGVTAVTWTLDADHLIGVATITLEQVDVELGVIDTLDTLHFRDAAAG